jgi:sensor domain CHASE-containing protein
VLLRSLLAHREVVETDSDVRKLLNATEKLTKRQIESCVAGIIVLSDGPVLVSIHPILRINGRGPSRGILRMARDIDYHLLAQLSSLIQLPLIIKEAPQVDQPGIEPSLNEIR